MSKRPKNEKSPNPFKALKGFRVSPSEPPRPPAEKKTPAPRKGAEEDDFGLYTEEMRRLGLPAPRREPEAAGPKKPSPPPARPAAPATDRELFLTALGRLEATFSDEVPEEEALRAEPRRMRQVRQGRLAPEAELDLHGLTRAEARQKVLFFLENAAHHGKRTVLLITGRGLGSGGEPVVRAEVERCLEEEGRGWVSEWGRAPRKLGGEGALIVFLREAKKS